MGNGIKTFFKVLYIAFALIIAVFVAIITYNNYENKDTMSASLEKKDEKESKEI